MPVDYNKLAKQSGAVSSTPSATDYTALAKEAGAVSSSTPNPQQTATGAGVAAPSAGIVDTGLDVVRGIGAGVLSTVFHGGDMIRRGLGMERIIDNPDVQGLIKPKNSAQEVGYGGEKAAEFMLPGGLVARAAKGMNAGLMTRAGLEALSSAGVAGVQTGGDMTAMRDAAVVGGAVTGGVGALAKAAPFVGQKLKDAALTQYKRVINPTTKANKKIADQVVPEMIDRGIVATSLPRLLEKAQGRTQHLGQQVDDVWDRMDLTGTTAQIGPLLQRLDDVARETYYTKNANGQLVILGDVAEQGLKQIEGLGEALINASTRNPVNGILEIPAKTLRDFRQYWDKVAHASGAFTKSPQELASWSRGQAHKAGSDAIRAELATATPDLAALNREFSFWKRVGDVTESTLERRTGQAKPLTRRLAQLGGTAAGASAGGPLGAVAGSVAMDQLQGLLISPAWGTVSAVVKDRLANSLMRGNRGEIEFYVQKALQGAGGAKVTVNPSLSPATTPAQ